MLETMPRGVICPNCQNDKSKVIETKKINGVIYRERICNQCKGQGIFYTQEKTIPINCITHDIRKIKTTKIDGGLKRKLKCKECNLIFCTVEIVVGYSKYNKTHMKAEIGTANEEIKHIFQFI